MKKKAEIHKAKKDYAEPEPKYEDQDREYGKGESPEERQLIDLTGHWFVYFGAEVEAGKMEGSRILTLNGKFDPDTLIDVLVDNVQKSMPKYAQDFLAQSKHKVIIRSFNRIDNPVIGGI